MSLAPAISPPRYVVTGGHDFAELDGCAVFRSIPTRFAAFDLAPVACYPVPQVRLCKRPGIGDMPGKYGR